MIPLMDTPTTGGSRNKRVLVAMELRSYRQAMALALQGLLPGRQWLSGGAAGSGPGGDAAAARPCGVQPGHAPGREAGPELDELYPDHELRSVVTLRGVRSTLNGVQLSDHILFVNRSEPAASL